MQYRTHIATSLAISLPLMGATDTLSLGSVGALALGTVFPDIDEPHSWIGARTRGLSDAIHLIFGHRGLTHSLMGLILAFLTVLLMVTLTNFNLMTGMYFVMGYGLHLIEDSFSKSGVKWLLPFTDTSFQFGNGLYYTTGGLIENLILLGSVVILVVEIQTLRFEAFSLPNISIPEVIGNLLAKIQGMTGSVR